MALTERLRVSLNDEEIRARADELASVIGDIEHEEKEKKEEAAHHNEAIGRLENRSRELAMQIRTKSEERDVECELVDVVDLEAGTGEHQTIRKDTREVIHREPMTRAELDRHRQGDLPLEGEAPAAEGIGEDDAADPGEIPPGDTSPTSTFICRNCGTETESTAEQSDAKLGAGFCSIACVEEFAEVSRASAADVGA